jgi:succinyl-diaminopimelate desuccinylase
MTIKTEVSMNYKDQIEAYFSDKGDALVSAVSRLVAIPSVKGETAPGAPFGSGPAQCLEEALTLARELGLTADNQEGYVGTVDLNDGDTVLHILGHLDVVAGGTGWTVTEPYAPKVVDGVLYGRGVADDKGPMVAALLAMQAVKDLNIPLRHNVRAIFGTDEESGSADIAHYYAAEPYAPYTFSPDADFPVINIEKGFYKPEFSKEWAADDALPRILSFQGGERLNVVPARASAVIQGMPLNQLMPRAQVGTRITGAEFRLKPLGGDRIQIDAIGKSAHAMAPGDGLNAITALLELLGVLPLAESESKNALHALLELLPHKDVSGKGLHIAQSDEISGELTVAFSLLEFTETGVKGRFDSRTPLCANEKNCQQRAEAAFAQHGFTCKGDMAAPHHTDADSPFVQTLLRCYEAYTGQKGEALAIGGGTYVHDIPGGVAFGATMPGCQTNLHAIDEHIPIQDLLTAAKIYAQVIVELCA